MPNGFISVIIPVRNESRYISEVLDGLLGQDYSQDKFEIIVVDGCSSDKMCEVVNDYISRYANRVRLFSNEKLLSSAARNIGILNARGEIILIVDGHCIVGNSGMFKCVNAAFEESGADCLGRPQPLEMNGATLLQWAIATCRRSRLGHHPDSFIYSDVCGVVPAISVAAIYRRDVFERVGFFDESFDACEDVELNYRVDVAGLRCYFDPSVAVGYVPRSTFFGLAFQMFRYGRGRIRLYRKHPDTFSIKSFGLGFFVFGLILGFLISLLDVWFGRGWFFLAYYFTVAFYLATVSIESVRLSILQRKLPILFFLIPVFLTIHFSFGWGIIRETLSKIISNKIINNN
ncbi:MAG: glycosyltransferase family 2 protein [Planctomycetaceae bacterium]|jgi:glycosyltransferase involved in cell wall biosynthesis|nr:glycosyltransferase family 2 protein [Planctomycetaceae bacterium]